MTSYVDETAAQQLEAEDSEALLGPLAHSVRALIDAAVRTEADEQMIREATADLQRIADRLSARQLPGPYGVHSRALGRQRTWASPVIGVRNPIAPPLALQVDPDGRVWSDFEVGAGYEGPPGLVHGGVSALILDHVLGEAVHAAGSWGKTGTLRLRYVRPTPLGRLRAESRVERIDGRKAFAVGTIADEGGVTVEATGIFILPADSTAH